MQQSIKLFFYIYLIAIVSSSNISSSSDSKNNDHTLNRGLNQASTSPIKSFKDYQNVYNEIAQKVRNDVDADEGSGRYAILVRLA